MVFKVENEMKTETNQQTAMFFCFSTHLKIGNLCFSRSV
jgi:hypothetical protein